MLNRSFVFVCGLSMSSYSVWSHVLLVERLGNLYHIPYESLELNVRLQLEKKQKTVKKSYLKMLK